MRKLWPGIVAILASAAFALAKFNQLPEQVVSHWGADGTPNGWMSRAAFVFGMHGVLLLVAACLAFAPQIDPKRYNFASHSGSYWLVANVSLALVAAATVMSVGANIGWKFHVSWLGFGLGALLVILGNVTTRIRPNWIFGLRTPWTLSSEKSWRTSNRFAGYGFVLLGLVVLVVTAVRPSAMLWILLPGSIGLSLAATLVSYFVWKHDPLARHN